MGIYDRDYYRDEEPTYWQGWSGQRGTFGLMIAVGAIFAIQVLAANPRMARPDLFLKFGAFDASAILQGEFWRVLTHYFIHPRGGLIQVAIELVVLYVFGSKIERFLGTREYFAMLICCGLTVAVGKLLAAILLPDAFGGISYGGGPIVVALAVLYIFHFGRTQVQFIATVPAWVPAVIVVVLGALGEYSGGSPAFGVLGYLLATAFAVGYRYLPYRLSTPFGLGRKRTTSLRLVRSQQDSPSELDRSERLPSDELRVPKSRAKAEGASAGRSEPALDEHLEAKLDQVLEKIARAGKASLTEDEQAVLQRAGEVFKRRKAGNPKS